MVNSPSVTPSDLVEELAARRAKEPVGNALLDAAADGRLPGDAFHRLVGTEAQAHTAELAAYGTALARFPRSPAADLFIRLARLVYDAQPKLQECARALGLTDVHGRRWPPERTAYAFNGTLSWLAAQGSQAAFALAVHTDMQVYFPGCAELVRRVRATDIDVPQAFLTYYEDEAPEELTRLALDVVQDGLDRGDDPQDAVFCARLLEESIGDFWRAAAGPR
ncbi:hypothetical protein A6A06_25635 [Streptomyces sp. CB02923]|uniref:hypothetical protein n=1 Tax=Streptomyces sp. CB02923 TaxID=1718985 RepID=UPI00093B6B24|nr:hypothetical protein [Streptomyces sp. CB02923]OKH98986.1 hypothetical protein A6A06_25635 [Streptomyces sp. CB02923]